MSDSNHTIIISTSNSKIKREKIKGNKEKEKIQYNTKIQG